MLHKDLWNFPVSVRLVGADWPTALPFKFIFIWVHLCKMAAVERTSGSDEAETDGREANHQSLRERQGRSHLSLDAHR